MAGGVTVSVDEVGVRGAGDVQLGQSTEGVPCRDDEMTFRVPVRRIAVCRASGADAGIASLPIKMPAARALRGGQLR